MNQGDLCPVCHYPAQWFPPGVSRRTGQPYDGFWGCGNKRNHPRQQQGPPPPPGNGGQWGGQQQPYHPPPQRPGPMPTSFDVRERSIAAQSCAKAACDAAGSIAPAMTQEAAGWIVALADALFQQVVRQAQGLPSGPVTPQGHPNAPDYQQDQDIPF